MNPGRIVPALLASLLLISGCSLEYQDLAESLDEETPSLRMSSVTLVSMEEGRERFRIEANTLEDYEKLFRRDISDAAFTEYDKSGGVSAEGRADRIRFDTRSDDAELSGNIRFTSIRDEATVSADHLEWKDDKRQLSGSAGGEVILEKDDGTRVRGRGFSADFPSRTFRFSGGVSGTYILDSAQGDAE